MRITRVAISSERAEHIWTRHQVLANEVREAVEQGRVYRGPRSHSGGRTYVIRGRTYAGRRLKVLVRPRERGLAILITAMEDPD